MPEIANEINQLKELRGKILEKAMKVVQKQGLEHDERVTTLGSYYYNNLTAFAEAKVSFFVCNDCNKPYYGGLIDCEQEMGMEDSTRKEDLLCKPCLMKEMSVG